MYTKTKKLQFIEMLTAT